MTAGHSRGEEQGRMLPIFRDKGDFDALDAREFRTELREKARQVVESEAAVGKEDAQRLQLLSSAVA